MTTTSVSSSSRKTVKVRLLICHNLPTHAHSSQVVAEWFLFSTSKPHRSTYFCKEERCILFDGLNDWLASFVGMVDEDGIRDMVFLVTEQLSTLSLVWVPSL